MHDTTLILIPQLLMFYWYWLLLVFVPLSLFRWFIMKDN